MTASAAPATAAPTPAPPAPALTHRQVLTILSGLLLGMLMASLDQTIVATALPTIVGDLGGLDFYSWSITAYLLATTVSTPVYGKLGDIIGRKRVFQVAIVIFLVGSVLCGLSRSMGELVAARAVQGIGAGGLIVVAQAIIADVVSPRERGRYQGYFGAVFGASSVLGPLLGGWFTEALSWRWVFYVNIPVGIAALVVTSVVLPFDRRHRSARIDYAGVALFSAAICCVVLLTTWGGSHAAWTSPTILGLGAASLVLLGLFVVVERRVAEPLLPLRLFKGRVFAVCCGLAFLVGFAMYATVSFVPVFLQIATGASPTTSGLLLLPLMGGLLFGTVLTGQLVTRTGRYKIFPVVGMAMATVGLVLLSTIDADVDRVTAGAYMLLLGLGIGFMIQIVVLAAQNSVARRDLGVATSSINFFRSIGGSIGTAVVGSLFAARLASELTGVPGADELDVATITPESVTALPTELGEHLVDAVSNAFTHSLLYLVPFLAAGFVLALALRELPLQGSEPAPPGAGSAQGGEDVGGEQLEVPVDQVVGHAGDARPQVDVLDR